MDNNDYLIDDDKKFPLKVPYELYVDYNNPFTGDQQYTTQNFTTGYQEGYWCWVKQKHCPYADRMTGSCMSNVQYEQCNGRLEYGVSTTYDGTCPYTITLNSDTFDTSNISHTFDTSDEIKKEIL